MSIIQGVFFRNAEFSAETTKFDLELIRQLNTVIIIVTSGHGIEVEKFRLFTHHTVK